LDNKTVGDDVFCASSFVAANPYAGEGLHIAARLFYPT